MTSITSTSNSTSTRRTRRRGAPPWVLVTVILGLVVAGCGAGPLDRDPVGDDQDGRTDPGGMGQTEDAPGPNSTVSYSR